MQRRTIYFSGQVQGVGFRYTTRQLAGRYPVSGFVRNLSDGRVQLLVEGESSHIDGLLNDISSQMGRYIDSTEQTIEESTGEFASFEIRR